ncbi:branched-chain amino acid ABC transporter permease [Cryobacterium psychrophilum]|uniref:Branched-chain amino acid ABC transporter permease n=1 Tax=Cryobacterium psychrophilum TaxID=41988 RepID=A0A4Y8KXB9_9MICO|nr:branched-chain amino acid ABC transporter permease [Cryobacterium psychrophilum]TDW29512.1 amino acid/amide ABC transporter membrane protein 1 (HAAT family) [Cryobacterium psychrophilum]TFD81646.1 branched-chain amino acid ABC transporter permease [Cryobacterium psychrophilum]
MNLDSITQSFVNGILLGGVYGGLAIGLSLILGVLGVLNLAHSAIIIFAALLYWEFVNGLGLDPLLMIAPVVAIGYGFGLLVHRGIAQHLVKDKGSTVMLAFFGLLVILESVAVMIWTTDTRTVSLGYLSEVVEIGSISAPVSRLVGAGITIVVLVALHFFLTRTLTGSAIRGLAQNRDVASMVGIDVNTLSRRVFAAGIAFAAFGGIVLAMVQSFNPQEHYRWLAWAFLVVILGGLGSALRTLISGFIVGIVETMVGIIIPFQYTYLVLYGILAVALLVRSEGLGGVKQRII